jgi:hypothetical protein
MTTDPSTGVEVHKGRKVGVTVSLRLKPDEAEILAALSRRYDTSLSETLRLGLAALASRADYTRLTVQSSGLGGFTRADKHLRVDETLALTA